MSVQSQIEHLLQRYVQAFNAHDMKILDLFQSRAEVYTPYSPPAVGHKELQALHTKWFTHKIAYKDAAVQHLTSRDGVAYCFASYALTRSDGDEGERKETGTSANVMIEGPAGNWTFLSTSIFPDES